MQSYSFYSVDRATENNLIRLHVKAIASEIDHYARRLSCTVLGDPRISAELMELAMAVVLRFFRIHRGPWDRGTTKTLLRASYRRFIQRHATQANHRELWGGCNDVEEAILAAVNSGQSHDFIDSERIIGLLSKKSRIILALRDVGYTWKEVGHFLSISGRLAKRLFQDELRQALAIADHAESRQIKLAISERSKRDDVQ